MKVEVRVKERTIRIDAGFVRKLLLRASNDKRFINVDYWVNNAVYVEYRNDLR